MKETAVYIKSESSVFAFDDLCIVKERWNNVINAAEKQKVQTIVVDGQTMIESARMLTYGLIGLIAEDLRAHSLSLHLTNIEQGLARLIRFIVGHYFDDLSVTINARDKSDFHLIEYKTPLAA
ncbi:hypothetical protein [Sneathiella limimaris]|uniref:hypothetical protein n=1 Tax=Sneathiella limimaris TaxID=1964213 RepID=UPI00146A105D|nr:hypothetical protein [Sneathiella limimaris]